MSVYQNDKFEYLKESVQSILNQTFSNFDFFIFFDGPVSPDIENYFKELKDERIKFFRIEKNCGLAKAMNYLLHLVLKNPEYKFIARMDADDISMECRIEKQRFFLLSNPDISCVGCWYYEIDEFGNPVSSRTLPVEHYALKKRYYFRTPFIHPSVMFVKNMIENTGFYPTNTILMEDNVLWGNALKAGLKFANISEFLFKFRKDNNFYKRRSGLFYGWNYILTRFKISRSLKFPLYSYLFSFVVGIIKMMPTFIVKQAYLAAQKF